MSETSAYAAFTLRTRSATRARPHRRSRTVPDIPRGSAISAEIRPITDELICIPPSKRINRLNQYDKIRNKFTCAQKLTGGSVDPAHGTKSDVGIFYTMCECVMAQTGTKKIIQPTDLGM